MKWIIDNWSFIVLMLAAGGCVFLYIKKFIQTSNEEQIAKVKEWLLFAVIEAEKYFGAGTGVLKLRYVYSLFMDKFPALADVISFEMFSKLVDEVLEQMKNILETNKDIEAYVKEN